ncbi:hypothetical protein VPH35_090479 [Triticum aestivum]
MVFEICFCRLSFCYHPVFDFLLDPSYFCWNHFKFCYHGLCILLPPSFVFATTPFLIFLLDHFFAGITCYNQRPRKLQSKVMEFGTGHDAKSFNHGMVAPGDTGSCSRRHGGATTATTKMDGDRRRGRRPTAMWTVTGDRRSATEGEDGDRRRAGDASRSAPGESMAGCPGRIALLDWT